MGSRGEAMAFPGNEIDIQGKLILERQAYNIMGYHGFDGVHKGESDANAFITLHQVESANLIRGLEDIVQRDTLPDSFLLQDVEGGEVRAFGDNLFLCQVQDRDR